MELSTPIYRLKRQARQLARQNAEPLHTALDEIARREGFRSWSHLSALAAARTPAERLLNSMRPGELVLLAGRPGQGKTRLALATLGAAARQRRDAWFFTLEYTGQQARQHLAQAGIPTELVGKCLNIDTSDDLSAEYLINRLTQQRVGEGWIAVIDYLQLLDQSRRKPELEQQLSGLKRFAEQRAGTILLLSQVDRHFDEGTRAMPDFSDIRLPNPVNPGVFNRFCAIHDGRIAMREIGI